MFDMIAFHADDTLWHSESLYAAAQERFAQLMAAYCPPERVEQVLHQTEMRNLGYYGYGIKGFALSLIEAAIQLSEGRVQAAEIQQVLGLAKDMLGAKVHLLEHAGEAVARLAAMYPLMLITKGDLFDQETKLARSGLRPFFRHVEIVSDKTPERYADLLARYELDAARFLMVGNSLRSDILPVMALGGRAVYIPYHITWAHEQAPLPETDQRGYYELEHLGQLPALIERLCQGREPLNA